MSQPSPACHRLDHSTFSASRPGRPLTHHQEKMSAPVADFDHIYRGLQPTIGKMRIAASGLGWKPSDSPNIVTVAKDDIKWVQWIKVARGYQLRIGLNKDRADIKMGDRRRESFDGFRPEDQEKLSNLFKQHFHVTLETKDLSLRGWNWGKMDVQASDLAFLVAGKLAFEVPLGLVHNSSISKTEVAVEFLDQTSQPKLDGLSGISRANAKKSTTDQLVEMRLYVPGNASTTANEGNSEADDPDNPELSAAQALHDLIMEKAEIGRVQGEGIVTFPDVLCTTPRGRYDIDMHADFLRLRGKTYDYKVLYSSIQRLFLLPKPDDIHFNFVVQLDPPIRQGQTRYPFLVMQFAKDEEIDAELNLDDSTIEPATTVFIACTVTRAWQTQASCTHSRLVGHASAVPLPDQLESLGPTAKRMILTQRGVLGWPPSPPETHSSNPRIGIRRIPALIPQTVRPAQRGEGREEYLPKAPGPHGVPPGSPARPAHTSAQEAPASGQRLLSSPCAWAEWGLYGREKHEEGDGAGEARVTQASSFALLMSRIPHAFESPKAARPSFSLCHLTLLRFPLPTSVLLEPSPSLFCLYQHARLELDFFPYPAIQYQCS
ncbi:hypothetical protein PtB15_7B123 [Puccinia triticina]|nr:hypothetical protein PtB15_7B123 [Puccinia triticina]